MESASQPAEVASDTEKTEGAQASSRTEKTAVDTPQRRFDAWTWLVAAFAVVVCVLPILRAGLWDPAEIEVADLGRRAAVHLWGAEGLRLDGATDEIPTVEEVGRGELPVLSVGLGLRLFGASAWAARLPLALWTLLGVWMVYWTVRRLEGRRAGLLTVAILVTSPLVFTQARTALGDAVTMAALALAFGGLLLAWADVTASARLRSAWLAVAVFGIGAGVWSRGVLLGAAVPLLGLGLTWLVTRTGDDRERFGFGVGLGSLVLGLGTSVWGLIALRAGSVDVYSKVVGSAILDPKQLPTHDVVVQYLGHGLFPWSALLPLSLGALLRPCSDGRRRLRLGLVLIVAVAFLFYGLTVTRTGPVAFGATFALAAACAITALSFERGQRGVFSGMVCAALLVLLYKDFDNAPEKGLSVFNSSSSIAFPEAFKGHAKRYLQVVTGLGVVACVGLVLSRTPFTEFATAWSAASSRVVRWLGAALAVAVRTYVKLTQPWAKAIPMPRAIWITAALGAGGTVLSLGYYPALAAQLSPAGVYTAYRSLARQGEPLAVMGEGAVKGSMFYAGSSVRSFRAVDPAIDWLVSDDESRKWLILKAPDLGRANSHFREKRPGKNLPVRNADSSEILLVSSSLEDGANNENPFNDLILSTPPKLAHTPEARWGDELELVGWEVREAKTGKPTDTLRNGIAYHFVTGYRVKKRVVANWEAFIHIDGNGKRVNGDHQLLGGKYPARLWLPGDIVLDTHDFKLDATYDPGEYTVYFGLYSGSKRFKLTAGEQKDDRLTAGVVHVAR